MVSVPLPVMVAVWPAVNDPVTPAMVNCEIEAVALAKASLVRTLPVRTTSSVPVTTSLTAPSGMTVSVRLEVAVTVPSVSV